MADFGTAVFHAILDNAQLLAGAGRARTALGRIGEGTAAVGSTLTRRVTLPVLAIGAASVKASMSFQKNMTLVRTQGGATEKQLRQMTPAVRNLSTQVGIGPASLAEALFHVQSASGPTIKGLQTTHDKMVALRIAAQGAQVGNASLDDTTYALVSAMNSQVKGATNAHNAMAELNAIVGSGDMRFSQLVVALRSGVLPAAKSFGVSMQSVGAALTVMTDRGIPATTAARQLRVSMSLLGAPSKQAAKILESLGFSEQTAWKHATAMQKALQTAGVSTTQLSADMRKPNGIIVALRDMRDHMIRGGLSADEAAATISRAFGGGQQSVAIQTLIQNLDTGDQKFKQIGRTASKFGEDWKATQQTSAYQAKQLEANVENLGISIGNGLLPMVSKIVAGLNKAIDAFQHLPGPMRTAIKWAALVAAALGPILLIGGSLLKTFSRLGSLIGTLSRGIDRLLPGGAARAAARKEAAATGGTAGAAESTAAFSKNLDLLVEAFARAGEAKDIFMRNLGLLGGAFTRAAGEATVAEEELAAGSAGAGAAGGAGLLGRGGAAAAGAAGAEGKLGLGARLGRGASVGLGLGLAGVIGGELVKGNSKANSGRSIAGGTLTGAGYGAGIGATLGSVVPGLGTAAGAAVGGAIGGGIGLAKSIVSFEKAKDASDSYRQSLAVTGKAENAFAANVLQGGSAVKQNRDAIARAALVQTDLTSKAAKAGLTQTDLTNAITGTNAQYNRTIAAWRAQGQPSKDTISALSQLRAAYQQSGDKAREMALQLGIALPGWTKTGTAIQLLKGKLGNFNAENLTVRQTVDSFHNRLANLTTAVRQNGTSLDQNTSFGQKNREAIRQAAAAALAHAQALYRQTGNAKLATAALAQDREKLVAAGRAAGLSAGQVKKVADQLYNIPKNVHSKIHVDTAQAKSELNNFGTFFDNYMNVLQGKAHVTPQITGGPTSILTHGLTGNGNGGGTTTTLGHNHPGFNAMGGLIQRAAGGGERRGIGGARQDNLLTWLSNGEFVTNARSFARNAVAVKAINADRPDIALASLLNSMVNKRGTFAQSRHVESTASTQQNVTKQYYFQTYNPVAERASNSIARRVRSLADLGAL